MVKVWHPYHLDVSWWFTTIARPSLPAAVIARANPHSIDTFLSSRLGDAALAVHSGSVRHLPVLAFSSWASRLVLSQLHLRSRTGCQPRLNHCHPSLSIHGITDRNSSGTRRGSGRVRGCLGLPVCVAPSTRQAGRSKVDKRSKDTAQRYCWRRWTY